MITTTPRARGASLAAPALLFSLLLVHCSSAPPPPAAPPPADAPAQSSAAPATPPAAAALDLSTEAKARATIYDVLKRGDKEAFKKCVTKRILDKQSAHFDEWYGVWKAAADKKPPEGFQKITVSQEDGQWKLDEN